LIEANGFKSLTKKRLGGLGVSPRGLAEIDQSPGLIDCAPQVTPSAIYPQVRLIHVPLQATP